MDSMDRTKFTVAWICALPIELTAARSMLDKEYDVHGLRKHPNDTNSYILGKIAGHEVVVTCLESAGNNNALSVAHQMKNTFENLRFGLMVGIGGGIPCKVDIRLGDVVVSKPSSSGTCSGVIQYDSGKSLQGGVFMPTGYRRPPPSELLKALPVLISNHEMGNNCTGYHIQQMFKIRQEAAQVGGSDYRSPGKEHDHLYEAAYEHQGASDTCADCDKKRLVSRRDRPDAKPVVHYGNIASGNSVMRDGVKRDQIGRKHDALCFEMEAAGLTDVIGCLIIRGICDYADSHKNKRWQKYAAATAAAYAKELLGVVSSSNVEAGQHTSPTYSAPYVTEPTVRDGVSSEPESYFPLPAIRKLPSRGTEIDQPPIWEHNSSPKAPTPRFPEAPQSPSIRRITTLPSREDSIDAYPELSSRKQSPTSPERSTRQPSLPRDPLTTSTQNGSNYLLRRFTCDQPASSGSSSTTRSLPLAQDAWESREGEVILIETQLKWSESKLMRYHSDGGTNLFTKGMSQCECRVFELVDNKYTIPTRRISVRSCEGEEQHVSYWMPLDQVQVQTEGGVITISWSDCAQSVNMSMSKDYRTSFKCIYRPKKPNRQLVLECMQLSVIRDFVDVFLYPTLRRSNYEQIPSPSESSRADKIRLYKHPTCVHSSNALLDGNPEFAILISSTTTTTTGSARFSQLYFGRSCLDFQIDKAKDSLVLSDMRCLDYTSNLEKPAENDFYRILDPEGKPDMCIWQTVSVNYEGPTIANVMEILTGWQLLFYKDASAVILKEVGRSISTILGRRIELGEALVMVWKAEAEIDQGVQLLVRALSATAERWLWLSVSLTSTPPKITMPDVKSIFIQAEACLRGPAISIYQMSVDTSSSLAPKTYSIQIQFKEEEHKDAAWAAVKPNSQQLRRATTTSD